MGRYLLHMQQSIAGGTHISFCIDENRELTEIDGVPVVQPEQYEALPDDTVIICLALDYNYDKVRAFLARKGVTSIIRYTDIMDGRKCLYYPTEADTRMCCNCIIRGVECEKSKVDVHRSEADDPLYLDNLSVIATTACPLNCRECNSRIPEFKAQGKRFDLDFDEFVTCWNEFKEAIIFIRRLVLVGGEIFLYPRLQDILKFLCDEPKIGAIEITTTALIDIPQEMIDMLRHEKIVVAMDNYGDILPVKHRERYSMVKEKLSAAGINTIEIDNRNGTWYSLLDVSEKGRTEQGNIDTFNSCGQSGCFCITQDICFERCGRATRLQQLGYSGIDPKDMVDLKGKTAQEIRRELLDYLKRPALTACGCCNGYTPENIVRAGEQV